MLDLNDKANVALTLIKELLSSAQSQSRVSGIWKQSAAMIALLRAYRSPNHILIRNYHLLVGNYAAPPFFRKKRKDRLGEDDATSLIGTTVTSTWSGSLDDRTSHGSCRGDRLHS